jgi:hypothetical protein
MQVERSNVTINRRVMIREQCSAIWQPFRLSAACERIRSRSRCDSNSDSEVQTSLRLRRRSAVLAILAAENCLPVSAALAVCQSQAAESWKPPDSVPDRQCRMNVADGSFVRRCHSEHELNSTSAKKLQSRPCGTVPALWKRSSPVRRVGRGSAIGRVQSEDVLIPACRSPVSLRSWQVSGSLRL